MKAIALVAAIVLLAVGFYRLFTPVRPARKIAGPAPRPQAGGGPAAKERREERGAAAQAGDPPPAPKRDAEIEKAEPEKPKAREEAAAPLPSLAQEHDADEDITIITLAPPPEVVAAMNALAAKAAPQGPGGAASGSVGAKPLREKPEPAAPPPKLEPPPAEEEEEEDDEDDGPSAVPIVYDEDAAVDEPTRVSALILMSAAAQTDQGRRRRRNEDSFVVLEDQHLYVVADGMGGHAGGDVASKMAVEVIADAFQKETFAGAAYPDVPRRGAELAMAIQAANKAIYDHARAHQAYQGMGTTVVSARFSPNKQRVYFGHVGDSRCYRLRNQTLTQVTTDHTMGAQGVTGPLANHLNRAVGVAPGVKVDLIIARPRPDDVYLLCTDGLSKMVPDKEIQETLLSERDLEKAVHKLVEQANARGGRDNITVILVQVKDPKGLAQYIQDMASAGH